MEEKNYKTKSLSSYSMEHTYPDHYPPDCPPKPHNDSPGFYYRMIYREEGVRRRDFLSYYERGSRPNLEETDPCIRRAISIFSDINDAIATLLQFQNLRYRYIVQMNLPGNHGVIHHTPRRNDSHHDWWIPKEIDPLSYCTNSISGPY